MIMLARAAVVMIMLMVRLGVAHAVQDATQPRLQHNEAAGRGVDDWPGGRLRRRMASWNR
jgi:hypothetical protein